MPFAIFGPRRARLAAAALFTGFQLAEHRHRELRVLLLPGARAARLPARRRRRRRVARRLSAAARAPAATERRRRPPRPAARRRRPPPPAAARATRRLGLAGAAMFIVVSLVQALFNFTEAGPAPLGAGAGARGSATRWRLVNTYHLFAGHHARAHRARVPDRAATAARPGPRTTCGTRPGDPARAPDFVAPAPAARRLPALVLRPRRSSAASPPTSRCWSSACATIPAAVQPLFRAPLPAHPDAVRIVYWRYHFTTRAERRATGALVAARMDWRDAGRSVR